MKIQTDVENGIVKFTIIGKVDTDSAEQVRAAVKILDDMHPEKVVFDLADVEYISSVGLRQLFTVRKRYKETDVVSVINCSELVFEVFETTGFVDIMNASKRPAGNVSIIKNTFGGLLEYWAETEPDRPFIITGKKYSYKEINMAAKILAIDYMKAGIKKGSHVGVYGTNSLKWIINFFALQYAGAVTLLVNPTLKMNELMLLAEIGDMTSLCVGDAALDAGSIRDYISKNDAGMLHQVFEMSDSYSMDETDYANAGALLQNNVNHYDDPAVIIFSSGSTGRPKGVLLSAYNILESGQRFNIGLQGTGDDKSCLIAPLFHVAGLNGVLGLSMTIGASVVIPEDIHVDTIISTIEKEKCTLLFSVPTMLLAMINRPDFDSSRIKTLRGTAFGSAPMSESQIRMVMEKMPGNHFSVIYGLSELVPVSLTPYGDTVDHIAKTVGKAVDGVELKIVDLKTGKDCPAGIEGEIFTRGSSMMLSYYNLRVEDQAVDENDWLHSGDIGYIDEDGYLRLSGRLKEIIIRGGENIIPNEIAYAISSHENIIDAKVFGVKDDFWGESVAACIRVKDEKQWDESEMKQFLSDKIAKYKIPVHYELYDEFPLLANGKVDGVALKKDLWNRLGIK